MFSLIHEMFTHCTSCIRCDVLERSNVRCCSGNYDRVVHCAFVLQCLHQLCNSRLFLSYSYIDTDNIFAFLVDYCINCDSCLTGLSVTDDQLSLTFADRDHRIDGLDTCLQRFMYRFSLQYPRGRIFDLTVILCSDRAFTVDRLTKCIYNTSDHGFTYRNLDNPSCRFYDIPFFDFFIRAENYCTDIVFFKVQCHSVHFAREFQQLAGHAFFEAVYSGDPVAYLDYCSKIRDFKLILIALYLFFYDSTNFLRS